MANSLNQNPIVITGTQTSYKAAVALTLGTLFTLRVEKLYWENPNASGDQCVIIDPQSGINLFRFRCESANASQLIDWTPNPKMWTDFAVDQIDSGTLYIFTKAG